MNFFNLLEFGLLSWGAHLALAMSKKLYEKL